MHFDFGMVGILLQQLCIRFFFLRFFFFCRRRAHLQIIGSHLCFRATAIRRLAPNFVSRCAGEPVSRCPKSKTVCV